MEEEGAPPFGYSEAAMGEEPRVQELSPDLPAAAPGPRGAFSFHTSV